MNMKLSYRDKVIFIVVMVILVLVAGFFLIIKPKFAEIDSAKYNLSTKQQQKADIEAKISTLPTIIETMKTVATEVGEKQKIFLEEAHPYVNETYIRDALSELNAEITAMSTNYTSASNISKYVVRPANILAYENKMNFDLYNELPQEVYDKYNGVEGESYPGAVIGVTHMTVTFKSADDLKMAYSVIDRIAQDEKAIILNSISTGDINETSENGKRSVVANITMYSIFPLNVEKVLQETDEIKPLETETPAE